jgi:hypothetical protein
VRPPAHLLLTHVRACACYAAAHAAVASCPAEKGGKKGAAAEPDYDDGSLCSSSTAACSMQGDAPEFVDAQAAAFSEAIDNTYESRASTREKAWESMVSLLRNNVRLDDCYQR